MTALRPLIGWNWMSGDWSLTSDRPAAVGSVPWQLNLQQTNPHRGDYPGTWFHTISADNHGLLWFGGVDGIVKCGWELAAWYGERSVACIHTGGGSTRMHDWVDILGKTRPVLCGRMPQQRVAASTSRRYFFSLRLTIAQTDARSAMPVSFRWASS